MSSEDYEQLLEGQILLVTAFNARIKHEQDEMMKQLKELKSNIKEARTKDRAYDVEPFEQRLFSIEKKKSFLQDLVNRIPVSAMNRIAAADNGPVQVAAEKEPEELLMEKDDDYTSEDDDTSDDDYAPEDPVFKRQRTLAFLRHLHTTPIVEIS
jgi:hypothetical protein